MTLSDKNVIKILQRHFVSGWRNIAHKERYAGTSNTHMPNYPAQTVTNCSGHHNVQMFFMTSDGKVIHCLPGFWTPKHLIKEVRLAAELNKLYRNKNLSISRRNDLFLDKHLEHALFHDKDLRNSSKLQGFDKKNIERRSESDFKRTEGFIDHGLKKGDQVMHERMAERPFMNFESFDVAKYIDMGRKKYSYRFGMPDSPDMKKRKRKKRR